MRNSRYESNEWIDQMNASQGGELLEVVTVVKTSVCNDGEWRDSE